MCFESPEYAQHVESAIQYRTETNLVLLHVSPAVGGVPFNTIMQQCPANLKDKGIFNTLASELVDNDDDYLAIVLQEIAGRFTVQSEPSKARLHSAPADDSEIETKHTEMKCAMAQSNVSPRSTSEPQELDQDECPVALVIPVREEPTTSIPLERYDLDGSGTINVPQFAPPGHGCGALDLPAVQLRRAVWTRPAALATPRAAPRAVPQQGVQPDNHKCHLPNGLDG